MLFKNDTEEDKLISLAPGKFDVVKVGEEIELEQKYGKRLGFKPVRAKNKTADTEATANDESLKSELAKVEGIDKKTVKAIIEEFPTKEELLSAIKSGDIPFNEDVSLKLTDYFK